MPLKLVIGNKRYSSWSMRPWLLMRHYDIPFDEVVVPLRTATTASSIGRFGPAGKVPVLIDGATTVWESLAIIEYLAERHPRHPIWPADAAARAHARSLAAEMHSGFANLRAAYPMNMGRSPKPRDLDPETGAAVARDVRRLEAAWAEAWGRLRARAETVRADTVDETRAGPFLFGPFGAVDAMFAPMVNRLRAYVVDVGAPALAYMDAMEGLPAWRDWTAGAAAEGWRIDAFEDLR